MNNKTMDNSVCKTCVEKFAEESNGLADELYTLKRRVANKLREDGFSDKYIMETLGVDKDQLKMIFHSGKYPWGEN